jgi:hypothetical protein
MKSNSIHSSLFGYIALFLFLLSTSSNILSQNIEKSYSIGKNKVGRLSILIDNKPVSLSFIEQNLKLDTNGIKAIEKIKSNRKLRFMNSIAAGITLGFGISNLINNSNNILIGGILTTSGVIHTINIHHWNKSDRFYFQVLLNSIQQSQNQ